MIHLRASDLGKSYQHYERPIDRLLSWVSIGTRKRKAERWVLRHLNLEVLPGEAIGVVGVNGAGKSTLIKLLKGTLRPTEGEVRAEGRIASLELGVGFHPDFTGRQNVVTAGTLQGHQPDEIARLLPGIEAFAEIGEYIDQPLRLYSTGMHLRLAFSLATAVRPDIFLIDEALAVGDAYFTQKCVSRIRRFCEEGTTLLLVSHDAAAIKTLCSRAVLIDGGRLIRTGSPADVLDYYGALIAKQQVDAKIRQTEILGDGRSSTRSGNRRVFIKQVELLHDSKATRTLQVGDEVQVQVDVQAVESVDDLTVGISIRDRLGNEMFGTNTEHLGVSSPDVEAGSLLRATFRFPANLGIGSYTRTAAVHAGRVHTDENYDWWDSVALFDVIPGSETPFTGSCHLSTEGRVERLV